MVGVRCPLCERPVETVVTQRNGGGDLVAELYYHEGGEVHCIIEQPQDIVESVNIVVEKQDG